MNAAKPPPIDTLLRSTQLMSDHPMAPLLARALSVLRAHAPSAGPVPFAFWDEGTEGNYLARMDWEPDECGPRVAVLNPRCGAVVCLSLPMPFELPAIAEKPGFWAAEPAALLKHAINLHRAHYPCTKPLQTTWRYGASKVEIITRQYWSTRAPTPCLLVWDANAGTLRLAAQQGMPHVDPATADELHRSDDEIARIVLEEERELDADFIRYDNERRARDHLALLRAPA